MAEEGKIIVPGQQNREYTLPQGPNVHLYVQEMPGCRFNECAVCLASTNEKDVPKMKYLRNHFKNLWIAMWDAHQQGKLRI
jgi:hypothetical protein